ncbi:MAG: amidase domain-containing protein [Aminipila sp.]
MIDYNKFSAATYGMKFGVKYQNRIFKRMDNDCTNFISQCIWAGYGGTGDYNLDGSRSIRALRNRVANFYLQTPEWYGLPYGSPEEFPSLSFIRVEELWNYTINNNSIGPKAIGYNNGKHWTDLDVNVEQGDVVQFYQDDIGRYGHSVIIVSDTNQNIVDSMDGIYVAQHSEDFSYRPFIEAFAASTDILNGKLRLLKFQPTYF